MRYVNLILILFLLSASSCNKSESVKIAFLSDVHLHDIYTTLEGENIFATPVDSDGRGVTIRPMSDQLRSTRMFNENYFAFIAALDDIVSRDVDYVILPGDFSDNGQIYNLKALSKILDGYRVRHGIDFFITTGNHDPVHPYRNSNVSLSVLDSLGVKRMVYGEKRDVDSVVSGDVSYLGYAEIVENLALFGFMPKENYIYWESPFSGYSYDGYSYEKATSEATLELREYSEEGSGLSIPDVSYLVEPVEGLWILAIDANSYPVKGVDPDQPHNPSNYGSPDNGWSVTIKHKKHLVEWIKSVGERAKAEGKKLIAFSHYPAVDFFNGASTEVSELLGEKKMQLARNPNVDVAELLADAGISLHFAGHMHVNDLGEYSSKAGNKITNIQVPSIAGYSPGYKLLTLDRDGSTIETISIENVKNFDALFPIYATEHNYLIESGAKNIWSREILEVTTYKQLLEFHLKELVRLSLIPNDWRGVINEDMLALTGSELLETVGVESAYSNLNDFTLFDIIFDMYRLYYGGEVAVKDIGESRLKQYGSMQNIITESKNANQHGETYMKILEIIGKFARVDL